MPARLAAAALCLLLAVIPAPAQTRSIFDLPRARAQRAIITVDERPPTIDDHSGEMALLLSGVIADLRGRDLAALRATAPPNPPLGDAADAARLCTIHLESGKESKRLAVYLKDGAYIAAELDPEEGAPPARAELRADAFADFYHALPRYRGPFTDPADERARDFELPRPYTPGRFILDEAAIGERLLGGGKPRDEHPVRDLSIETLTVRLPKNYHPRNPAGLLVWVDAGPAGVPPPAFAGVLDDLNLIAIGAAKCGNQRNLYSRIQLALDAVATATERYHIDPRRTYIYGISGGGRVASIAQVCFPEVFMGAVPIVGMSCYKNVPNGMGQYYRAAYSRPGTAIFRLAQKRRIAPMTGRNDGNLVEMTNATDLMRRDGLTLKLFEDPKMGHELPSPSQFRQALDWIDEPWQTLRAKELEESRRLLEAYTSRHDDRPPRSPAERAALFRVMEAGPWTPAAWHAWDLISRAAAE